MRPSTSSTVASCETFTVTPAIESVLAFTFTELTGPVMELTGAAPSEIVTRSACQPSGVCTRRICT